MGLFALPFVGPLLEKIVGVVDKAIPDKDLAEKLKQELNMAVLNQDYSLIQKEIEKQAEVIVAEASGHSWLQRNWRPILMLTFTYIIAHNYIIAPVLGMMWQVPVLAIPPDLWDLLKLGIGGYIAGRSGEQIVKAWKGK